MRVREWLAIVAAATAAVLLSACGGPVYSYSYRLTIEVDTPDGLKSGSSVIETTVQDDTESWGPREARLVRWRTKGDAVFVDLGSGRQVIALLAMGATGSDNFSRLVPKLFQLRDLDEVRTWQGRQGRFTLPADLVPTLVTFADLSDPKTARVVRPDEFETVFGPGVRFKRAWIEMTYDPITRGIEKKIPWLNDYQQIIRAWDAMRKGNPYGPSTGPDTFFVRK